jgi:plastocyanin
MRLAPKHATALLVLVLATVLVACGSDDEDPTATTAAATPTVAAATTPATPAASTSGETAEVEVTGFKFVPEELTISVGTTVTWTNADAAPHTVTTGEPGNPDGLLDEPMPSAGSTVTHTFTEPGRYVYYCARHPSMIAVVIVE